MELFKSYIINTILKSSNCLSFMIKKTCNDSIHKLDEHNAMYKFSCKICSVWTNQKGILTCFKEHFFLIKQSYDIQFSPNI